MGTERAKQVRKTDKAFREFIFHRDGKTCTCCGMSGEGAYAAVIQCGHLFSRTNYAARWHERNAAPQCAGCNNRHEHDFIPFETYMRGRWGTDGVDRLYTWWNRAVKLSTNDLKTIQSYYEARTRGEMFNLEPRLHLYVGLK